MLKAVFIPVMGRLAVRASSLKSINPPALKGYLLVRKPGDFKWLWGEQPLSGPDEFSAAVLRELVGGDVRRHARSRSLARSPWSGQRLPASCHCAGRTVTSS